MRFKASTATAIEPENLIGTSLDLGEGKKIALAANRLTEGGLERETRGPLKIRGYSQRRPTIRGASEGGCFARTSIQPSVCAAPHSVLTDPAN